MIVPCVYVFTGITVSPKDVTVLPHRMAVFTCVISGAPTYMYWRVNGTSFDSLPSDLRDDLDKIQTTVGNNEQSNLTILGRVEYNNTTVQCVAGFGRIERESENAMLTVQGKY